jgi:CRP-like cAMP-binding protein
MVSRAFIDERLQQVPLFAACSKKELRHVSQLMTAVDVSAGTPLAREGKLGAEFVVIVEGKASVSKKGSTVATLGPGQWFGEIALLDDKHLRTATVMADTDMVVEVMDGPSFSQLIDDHPRIARKLLQGLAHLVASQATS